MKSSNAGSVIRTSPRVMVRTTVLMNALVSYRENEAGMGQDKYLVFC